MVGLNDIPCVGTALNQISEATVEAAIRECSYLLCYKRNVTTLQDKFKELGIQQEQMNTRIVRDRGDAKEIMTHVVEWQNEVNELNSQVEEFLKRYQDRPYWFKCFGSVSFPNLYSRFKLGREAVKKTETVTALTERTKEYLKGEISNYPSFENNPKSSIVYMKFRSRENAYRKLLEALKNEDGPTILGIYGMPGVGKTRMMEEAWKQSKNEGIFHEVARADVSQVVDVQKLQGQLARDINLHFPPEADEKRRAPLLESRLREGTKFLVILDDVWGEVPLNDIGIPLNAIGIPFGDVSNKGCKILLTSRTQQACDNNNCNDVIKIGVLEEDEAWELFQKIVGASKVDSLSDKILAKEVCKHCGGLPLVIVAVGKALQNKPKVSWEDALGQLENFNLENIDGIDPKMYAGLKLSFDHLPKDAKSCLLLSALFGEDAEIQFEELFQLVRGSKLLKGYDTIEAARIRVGNMVLSLKSSSLLLKGQRVTTVKLHDIVRDVARSIAARDQDYAFLSKSCGSEWPDEDDCRDRKLINLSFKSSLVESPDDLVCPDLRILRLECGNDLPHPPDKFFKGFPNLRVLLLYNVSSSVQRSSIQYLANLRTLKISNFKLSDLSLIVLLKKLEILCLHSESTPVDKPLDLLGLKHLRMLHLKFHYYDKYGVQPFDHCNKIAVLPHVLSSLSSLEELHIPRGLIIRDEAAGEFSTISPELSTLARLTNLKIRLDDAMSCPDENICKNLLRFKITVGLCQAHSLWERSSVKRSLQFSNGNLEGGVKTLAERAEQLYLTGVTGLQNIFTDTDSEAFLDLTLLIIADCPDVEPLRIPHRQLHQPLRPFSKLSFLEIHDSGFKYLFCASFARCLVQLKKLEISFCKEMEEIVRNEESQNDEKIEFPNLTSMRLHHLPKLTSFYCNQRNSVPVQQSLFNEMVTFPALKQLNIYHLDGVQSLFNGKVVFPNLEILSINGLRKLSGIWEDQCCTDDSFSQLKVLDVERCPKLETLIPLAMRQQLQHVIVDVIKWQQLPKRLSTAQRETNLAIHFDDAMSCPDENICKNLLRFNITVGPCHSHGHWEHSSAKRSLEFWNGNLEGTVKTLAERAERLFLCEVTGLQNIFTDTDSEAFLDLTWLIIQNCPDVEPLRIPHRQLHQPLRPFSKLGVLEIYGFGFKYLLCASFARCLAQLIELKISCCEEMEEIVRNEESQNDEKIEFPHLTYMALSVLPKLTSFYCNQRNGVPVQQSLFNEMVTFPALKKLRIYLLDEVQSLFNGKVVFPKLEILSIKSLEKLSEIWEKQCYICDSFRQLKLLRVDPNLVTLIPLPLLQQLQHLKVDVVE